MGFLVCFFPKRYGLTINPSRKPLWVSLLSFFQLNFFFFFSFPAPGYEPHLAPGGFRGGTGGLKGAQAGPGQKPPLSTARGQGSPTVSLAALCPRNVFLIFFSDFC